MTERWKLDPADVVSGGSGIFRIGARPPRSRALGYQECTVRLVHRPTGVEVQREVSGSHAKKEWRRLLQEVHAELMVELERAVRRHLRLPGGA